VGAGILVGNITGFFRVIVTAYLLGTHARADALAVAIGPIDTLNQVIINTMLVSFVPMLMLRGTADRAAIFARAGRAFAGILLAVTLGVLLLAPETISVLGPGLAREQHDQAVLLLRLICPATLCGGGSAIFAALLYTERRFLAPSLYQACLNGGTILAAMTLWKWFGINAFAVGYVTGTAIQLFAAGDFRDSGTLSHLRKYDRREHHRDARLRHSRGTGHGGGVRLLPALHQRGGGLSGLSGGEQSAARNRAFARHQSDRAGVPAAR
jgi:peptidoglycan biosynthesis protein MviN/MurJ (putative lipid II flippase)